MCSCLLLFNWTTVNIAAQHRSLHILCFHFLSHFFFSDSLYIPIIFCLDEQCHVSSITQIKGICVSTANCSCLSVCLVHFCCLHLHICISTDFFCLDSLLLFFYLTVTSEEECRKEVTHAIKMCCLKSKCGHWMCDTSSTSVAF